MQARLRGSPTQRSAPGVASTESAQTENSQGGQPETFSPQHTTAGRPGRILPEIPAGGSPPPRALPAGDALMAPVESFAKRGGATVSLRAGRRLQQRQARRAVRR